KAQRLSFGPAREAADAFANALEKVEPSSTSKEAWHVRALSSSAVASVREIQALQAPHIAEADDAVMTALEKGTAASWARAHQALDRLNGLVAPACRPGLTAARGALDRFMQVNAEIVTLSRRNTNVRSLALSLNQKRVLTAACEGSLQVLRDSL